MVCDPKKNEYSAAKKNVSKRFSTFSCRIFFAFAMQRMRKRRNLLCNSYVMSFHLHERDATRNRFKELFCSLFPLPFLAYIFYSTQSHRPWISLFSAIADRTTEHMVPHDTSFDYYRKCTLSLHLTHIYPFTNIQTTESSPLKRSQ